MQQCFLRGPGLTRCLFAAAIALSIARGTSRAADAYPPVQSELRQKVQRLVDALDAQTRGERLSAQDALLAMGPSILSLLPAEDRIASPAVRDAVKQIRERLELQRARSTLAVSRVTLHGEFPLAEILDRIAEQTGNAIGRSAIPAAALKRKLSIDDESRPFWSACDDIIVRAGLSYAGNGNAALEFISASDARQARNQTVADDGPIRVAVHSVQLRPIVGTASRKLLRISWSLRAEPRLRALFASIAARDFFVRTPDAAVLKPDVPDARLELSMGEGGQALCLDTDFVVPPGVTPARIEFGGSLHVETAAGPEPMIFDLGNPKRKRVGAVTVGLQSVQFHSGRDGHPAARLEVAMIYDKGGPAFESYRSWMYRNEAALVAKDGRRIPPSEIHSMHQQGDGSVVVEYNFANVEGRPGDYRFAYVVPTLIADLPVLLHFPNVPVIRTAEKGAQP